VEVRIRRHGGEQKVGMRGGQSRWQAAGRAPARHSVQRVLPVPCAGMGSASGRGGVAMGAELRHMFLSRTMSVRLAHKQAVAT